MKRRSLSILIFAVSVFFVVLFSSREACCTDQPVPLASGTARPGEKTGPTRVSVGIWLVDISKIDSVLQTFTANLFVVLSWQDPRLADRQAGGRKYNIDDIWHPELLATNAAAKLEPSLPKIAEVTDDGTVFYRQRVFGTFAQKLDLSAFPFDHATFRIELVATGNLPGEIHFVPNEKMVAAGMPSGSGISQELTLQDWRITGSAARSLPYRIAPGIERAGYVFEFQAERLAQHYIVKVIIPLLLIVMMSWASFWIDPSLGGAQISVATTSMLTLIAYRFSVGADVPKLPYLTNLDAFILSSSLLVLLTLIEVILTTTLACNNRLNLARAIDRYSRLVFPIAFVAVTVATLFN